MDISYAAIAAKLKNERVLLIGGAGFIGHSIALELRRHNVPTMVLDNLMINSLVDNAFHDKGEPWKRKLNLHFLMSRFEMMRTAGVEFINSDARILKDILPVFDQFQPTKIIHLSAIASAVEAAKTPGLCFDLQLITLRNVLEVCRTQFPKAQVMLMSSSTVYGDFETPIVDEKTRPHPRGIYANTKYMAERLVRNYAQQYGLGITIIRPSALYGERCVSRRVSQAFIENALCGRPLYLEGGGAGRLDFTYIQDLVEGIVHALALWDGPGTTVTYNMTFGDARTVADLATIVKSLIPDVRLEEKPRKEDRPIRGTLSMEVAKANLGFVPKWSLEKGYRQYCQWYIDQWNKVIGDADPMDANANRLDAIVQATAVK
jgi:nucleoside-diphosphate-sugar epimerase